MLTEASLHSEICLSRPDRKVQPCRSLRDYRRCDPAHTVNGRTSLRTPACLPGDAPPGRTSLSLSGVHAAVIPRSRAVETALGALHPSNT